jgi:multiple antibiotic resistance protein
MFIVGGRESFIQMRENLDDMASQLALPFMVGAGSVSVSILIGNAYGPQQ